MANEYYPQGSQTQRIPQHSQQYQQQQYQQQYQQPQYQQHPPRQMSFQQDDTTTGQWVLTLFLSCIPIVNLILLLVWAFSSNTEKSKSNWAKATLIWLIIGIVLCVALGFAASAAGVDVWGVVRNYYFRVR